MLVARQGRRALATYESDVSVAWLLSSAAAPAAPIAFQDRLQRGEEGQRCSVAR
jgi:hypothetical protein